VRSSPEFVRSADGTEIACDRVGAGPALVLVVGAFCDRATLRRLADTLAAEFTVYSYDRRGRGSSGDTPPYSVEREIEDLDAIIALAGGSAFVYGHSSGAIIALEAAARRVPAARLAVYEPPYIVDGTRSRPVDLTERVTALVSSGRHGDAITLFYLEGPQIPPEVVSRMQAGPMWPRLEALAPTLLNDLAVSADQTVPGARLATIEIPTLVLGGGASPDWARISAEAVAAAIPGARHVSVAGQTHAIADDVLAALLVEFFRSERRPD
jgi:pimeloyl-ACP methyl ester carboxylesterase